jgi:hypothetical protein
MILKEFKSSNARTLSKLTRALAENYDYNINLANMTAKRAAKMAHKAIAKVNESQDVNKRIKFAMIAESLDLWMQANVQSELTAFNLAEGIDDDSMEEAKVILAAKELSDKIQGMIEDAAKMQVQDLLPIVDAMRSEVGQAEAEGFATQADAALAGLVATLKSAKIEYDSAIQTAQGLAPANDMDMDGGMGDEMGGDMGDEMDIDGMDVDMSAMDDEFGGDDANIGDEEPTGREMKAEM